MTGHDMLGILKLFPAFQPVSQKTNQRLPTKVKRVESKGVQLTLITHPGKKSLADLQQQYGLHPLHVDDILSPIQRSKIDCEENYIFFVLHFPSLNPENGRIESREVDLVLTKQEVVAIVEQPFVLLEHTIEDITEARTRAKLFHKGAGLVLYTIVDRMVDTIFPLVEKLETIVEEMDQNIFVHKPQTIVEEISILRRNIIFFQTFIKPEMNQFALLEESKHSFFDREMRVYFGSLGNHLKKIWDRLEDVKELTDNLSMTFESYFSFKTNETIKVLTIFSVVLMPLTLLSGIYGMNLQFLPLSEHPSAILFIGLIMLWIVVAMLSVFKLKRWV